MAFLLSCRWLNRKEHPNRSTNNGDTAERSKRPYKLKILLLSKILFQIMLIYGHQFHQMFYNLHSNI